MIIQLDWLNQYVDHGLSQEALCHLLTMGGLELESSETVDLGGGRTTEVVELNVTPNRGYALSHIGVAREVGALTGKPLTLSDPNPKLEKAFGKTPASGKLEVDNQAPDLCPRYAAVVIEGVQPGPSPDWLVDRLKAIGLRPINNIVDITNFVMMEYGQPLHAFDLDLLSGSKIIIRRAKKSEPFVALDGTELKLEPDALVIADAEKPVALAGVMGGDNSQVTERTTTVALESAFFDPVCIRQASKKYGLRSDSSYRFEREVDIESVITAQSRAALLIQELAGGEILNGRIDKYPSPRPRAEVEFRVSRTNQVLGTQLSADKILGTLKAMGLEVTQETQSGEAYRLEIPPLYPNLKREIDLIEEVARLHGYDQIAVTRPRATLNPVSFTPTQRMFQECKNLLSHLGFSEAVNYSFIEEKHAHVFLNAFASKGSSSISLDNPISSDMDVMRTSLLPGLVKGAVTNLNKGQKSIRLFEEGNVFFQNGSEGRANEIPVLSVLVAGPHPDTVWQETGTQHDYYDVKGVLESVLQVAGGDAEFRPSQKSFLDSAQSVDCFSGEKFLAYCGPLSRQAARELGLESAVYVLEINVEQLAEAGKDLPRFQPLPRYPETYRDISILVDKSVNSRDISELIRNSSGPLLQRVDLYDQFEGKKLEAGKKSLTFALAFQSPEKTLTDEEVNPVFDTIVQALSEQLGATLRQ